MIADGFADTAAEDYASAAMPCHAAIRCRCCHATIWRADVACRYATLYAMACDTVRDDATAGCLMLPLMRSIFFCHFHYIAAIQAPAPALRAVSKEYRMILLHDGLPRQHVYAQGAAQQRRVVQRCAMPLMMLILTIMNTRHRYTLRATLIDYFRFAAADDASATLIFRCQLPLCCHDATAADIHVTMPPLAA